MSEDTRDAAELSDMLLFSQQGVPRHWARRTIDALLAAGWQLAPPGATVRPEAVCSCYPGGFSPETYEGLQPWCDEHGLPSAAWAQGHREGERQREEVNRIALYGKVVLDPESDEDILQLAAAIKTEMNTSFPAGSWQHASTVLRRLAGQENGDG